MGYRSLIRHFTALVNRQSIHNDLETRGEHFFHLKSKKVIFRKDKLKKLINLT